jgi:hypothetical protein
LEFGRLTVEENPGRRCSGGHSLVLMSQFEVKALERLVLKVKLYLCGRNLGDKSDDEALERSGWVRVLGKEALGGISHNRFKSWRFVWVAQELRMERERGDELGMVMPRYWKR